jgi:hypothetical protein
MGFACPILKQPSLIVLIVDNGLHLNRHPSRSKTTGPWSAASLEALRHDHRPDDDPLHRP